MVRILLGSVRWRAHVSGPVYALAVGSTSLYSCAADGHVREWQREGQPALLRTYGDTTKQTTPRAHPKRVRCLCLMGELLLTGSNDRTVRVWHRRDGAANRGPVGVLEGHTHWVRALSAIPMRKREAGGLLLSAGMELLLWRIGSLSDQWQQVERGASLLLLRPPTRMQRSPPKCSPPSLLAGLEAVRALVKVSA